MNKKLIIIVGLLIVLSGCSSAFNNEEEVLHIYDIQGCGHRSPLEGKEVSKVRGVVTSKTNDGFVMQSINPDGNSCSSEGIFVFTEDYPDVSIADLVEVSGEVTEYSQGKEEDHNLSQTEITNNRVNIIGHNQNIPETVLLGVNGYPLPSKVEDDAFADFDIENDALDMFESLEWMRVQLPESIVVDPRNQYNEISVVENLPEITKALSKESTFSVETEDTGNIPVPVMVDLPDGWHGQIQAGDILEGVNGIMQYSYGNFKLVTNTYPEIVEPTERENEKEDQQNTYALRVVSYNIENYSIYSSRQIIVKLAKQIAGITKSPDLIVFQEVEDDSGEVDDEITSAQKNLEILVEEIQNRGGDEYQYYDFPVKNNNNGGIAGGNIRTVFLLNKNSRLKLESKGVPLYVSGSFVFDSENRVSFSTNPMLIGVEEPVFSNSRKPSVGLFTFGDQQIIVIGIHFISHGIDTPLYGAVQPPTKRDDDRRFEQAKFVAEWVDKIRSHTENLLVIIAGDFNDHSISDTSSIFAAHGLINTNSLIPAEERFSIIEDGFASQFDQIWVTDFAKINQSLFTIHHLNTIVDEESAVSDHDPVEFDFTP